MFWCVDLILMDLTILYDFYLAFLGFPSPRFNLKILNTTQCMVSIIQWMRRLLSFEFLACALATLATCDCDLTCFLALAFKLVVCWLSFCVVFRWNTKIKSETKKREGRKGEGASASLIGIDASSSTYKAVMLMLMMHFTFWYQAGPELFQCSVRLSKDGIWVNGASGYLWFSSSCHLY